MTKKPKKKKENYKRRATGTYQTLPEKFYSMWISERMTCVSDLRRLIESSDALMRDAKLTPFVRLGTVSCEHFTATKPESVKPHRVEFFKALIEKEEYPTPISCVIDPITKGIVFWKGDHRMLAFQSLSIPAHAWVLDWTQ